MTLRAYLTGLLLLASATGAIAADSAFEQCTKSRDASIRLAACSEVIDSVKATGTQKAVAYHNRGDARLSAGAIDQAIADYSAALGYDPANAAAYGGRARAFVSRNDFERAIADFTEALNLTSGGLARVPYLIGRGHTFLVTGRTQQALADLTEAVNLNPKSASAHNHLGLAYRKAGDNVRALAEYTQAIMLNPVYALAYNNRGYVYEALGQRAEAIADFNRALLLDSSLTGASDGLKRLGLAGDNILSERNDVLIAEGKVLVEANCSPCHAVGATGASPNERAPAFRTLSDRYPVLSLREPLSRGIAAPHDVMPNFTMSEAQIDAIVAYINALNR